MANDRELKTRIKSVKGIGQLTQAMKMVASAQLRKMEVQGTALMPYGLKMMKTIRRLHDEVGHYEHPLLKEVAQVQRIGLIIIGSDNGLCGAYNSNILRVFQRDLDIVGIPDKLIAVGKKAIKYCNKCNLNMDLAISSWKPEYKLSKNIADVCVEWFLKGEVDQIWCYNTRFVNKVSFEPYGLKVLPLNLKEFVDEENDFGPDVTKIETACVSRSKRWHDRSYRNSAYIRVPGSSADSDLEPEYPKDLGSGIAEELKLNETEGVDVQKSAEAIAQVSEDGGASEWEKPLRNGGDIIIEPSLDESLGYIIPTFFRLVIHWLLLNSKISELSSRLNAMNNASDNADDLVHHLTLQYYRIRQENITNEIIEIASGAESLA